MATWCDAPRHQTASALSRADDATLIDRFLRGDDQETFEILVRRYRDKVFRLALSILGRGAESEAEDATQEVFVVVLRQLKNFRRQCAFSTWLYRVARNQIIVWLCDLPAAGPGVVRHRIEDREDAMNLGAR